MYYVIEFVEFVVEMISIIITTNCSQRKCIYLTKRLERTVATNKHVVKFVAEKASRQ